MLVVGLLCVVVLGGVRLTSGLAKHSPVQSSSTYNVEALFNNKTPYVGNNSKVVHLIGNLPYANLRKEVSLQTQTIPYGITVNYDFSSIGTNIQQIESTLHSNAIIMFALIDNVDVITFEDRGVSQLPNYQYLRAEIQKNLDQDLRQYAKDIKTFQTFIKKIKFKLLVFPEKYLTVMSKTPGIRITADYQGSVGKVRYSADNGAMLTWDTSTGKVSKGVQTVELPYKSQAFWSPISQDGQISVAKSNVVTVTLLDEKGEMIDQKQLTILYDGSMYTVKPSLDILVWVEKSQSQKPITFNNAVSLAIKAQRKSYFDGEVTTEGHIILDTEEKNGTVKAYTIASLGAFGFENGIFTKVSGSGAIPSIMIFSKNKNGEYSLLEYKEPEDGAGYTDSIKKMFPHQLQDKVLSAQNDYLDLIKQQEEQAAEYLKSIGRAAKVSAAHVEKELVDVNVQASNKLFAEFTKYDSFLNNCPYWIGTRERIENGVRYIYETSQSKTNDGYDLISFRKAKEDGTVVEEKKYKIVGSEPQRID